MPRRASYDALCLASPPSVRMMRNQNHKSVLPEVSASLSDLRLHLTYTYVEALVSDAYQEPIRPGRNCAATWLGDKQLRMQTPVGRASARLLHLGIGAAMVDESGILLLLSVIICENVPRKMELASCDRCRSLPCWIGNARSAATRLSVRSWHTLMYHRTIIVIV